MGKIFKQFLTGGNESRDCAQNETYQRLEKSNLPVKLIEPSLGRIVELQITEKDDIVSKLYMDQLTAYVEGLEKNGVCWTIIGKTFRIVCTDSCIAEFVRNTWRDC